jgi:hypothetical protein
VQEAGSVEQRYVASPATAGLGGARLHRAVGRNCFRDTSAGRPGGRRRDHLLGDVLRAWLIAQRPGYRGLLLLSASSYNPNNLLNHPLRSSCGTCVSSKVARASPPASVGGGLRGSLGLFCRFPAAILDGFELLPQFVLLPLGYLHPQARLLELVQRLVAPALLLLNYVETLIPLTGY